MLGKSIGNILAKVVTAPFTLLANALRGDGGGESLDEIPFPAGSATLTADGEQRLDKVANALVDRPALKLTIVGAANLEAERDAYRRQRLTEMLGAEKRGGAAASASTGERRALLQQALKRADLPLPSDASGKQKELTDSEIEALLLSQIEVDGKRCGGWRCGVRWRCATTWRAPNCPRRDCSWVRSSWSRLKTMPARPGPGRRPPRRG